MSVRSRLLVFFWAASATPAVAEEIPHKIDEDLGNKLASIAIGKSRPMMDTGGTESFNDPEHPFFIYELIGKHSGVAGWYAVNAWTGDVWDIMEAPDCVHYDTPALRKELDKVKARFSPRELKEYPRLRALKPGRITDLELCGSPEEP